MTSKVGGGVPGSNRDGDSLLHCNKSAWRSKNSKFFYKTQMSFTSSSTFSHEREKKALTSVLPLPIVIIQWGKKNLSNLKNPKILKSLKGERRLICPKMSYVM